MFNKKTFNYLYMSDSVSWNTEEEGGENEYELIEEPPEQHSDNEEIIETTSTDFMELNRQMINTNNQNPDQIIRNLLNITDDFIDNIMLQNSNNSIQYMNDYIEEISNTFIERLNDYELELATANSELESYAPKSIDIKKTKVKFLEFNTEFKREFVTEKEDGNNDCGICLNEFDKNAIIGLTKCKHFFHKECIEKWCENGDNCPYCRVEL